MDSQVATELDKEDMEEVMEVGMEVVPVDLEEQVMVLVNTEEVSEVAPVVQAVLEDRVVMEVDPAVLVDLVDLEGQGDSVAQEDLAPLTIMDDPRSTTTLRRRRTKRAKKAPKRNPIRL